MRKIIYLLLMLGSARAEVSCVTTEFIYEQSAIVNLPIRMLTIKSSQREIARAIEFYNSQAGDTVAEADALIIIELADGGFYMAFVANGISCSGARIRPSAVAEVRRIIFGTSL